ncbi:MAG: 50S ribosomal protein L13 [archaeon]|nr:MAG: 50S ribosomal protein L13 [archaeon]
MEIILDATNAVVGRLAVFAAKKALEGNKIIILNSEKAIITGNPKLVLARHLQKSRLGVGVQKGPNIPKRAEMILRRIIRGMLPWKRTKGREAYKRIKCFLGIPTKYKDKEMKKFEKPIKTKTITLERLSQLVRQK